MKKKEKLILYAAWLCLYILCVGLGTVEKIAGIGKVFFVLTSLIFFLPGACLLIMGIREKDRKTVLTVRIIAICSLALTVIVFCANVAAAAVGTVSYFLNDLLNVVSAPMLCSQYWVLSLFGWACLLFWAQSLLKKK